MICPKCGYELKKENIAIVSHYLIKPNKAVLEKKEILCPICGYVLKGKFCNTAL